MRRFAAGALLLLPLLVSCKTAAPPTPVPTIPPEERAFLLDPTVSAPSGDASFEQQVEAAYRSFDAGRPTREVAALAQKLLAASPDAPSALVLLAQSEYLEGRYRDAAERLRPVLAAHPGYAAAALVAGRSRERLGENLAAFEAYRGAADLDATAASKTAELTRSAVDSLAVEARQAAAGGRFEEAESILTRIDSLAPGLRSSLEVRLVIARGRRQNREEMALLRQLARLDNSREVRERLGQLEVEIGDVKAGLEALESLLREYPGDRSLTAQVERAKFRWRLERLPPRVQAIARKSELTRADLASLLYWLLPPVQHSPTVDPPIASDILNHPAQQEILRVTDLELMEVDETLHRFNPDVATSRRAALAALLAVLAQQRVPCVAGEPLARDARAWVCRKGAECGLLGDESQCQAATSISGSDAVDLIKACLDQLGDS